MRAQKMLRLLLVVTATIAQQIPRLLITSHAKPLDAAPAPLRANIDEWRRLNPTFEFKYFDDAAQIAWMRGNCAADRCLEAYTKLSSGAGKADMFRVALLYYSGGWWFDADLRPGDIAGSCGLQDDLNLFLVREPKVGHVRFMIMGGHRHPLLLANLHRQIANAIQAKSLPARQQPRTLHVTGPFTMGRTICDPFRFVEAGEVVGGADVAAAAADLKAHCHGHFFVGRAGWRGRENDGSEPERAEPKGDWAATYGAGSPLAFRFDSCKGVWHRPGSRMNYAAVLAAMNVSHHLKITA